MRQQARPPGRRQIMRLMQRRERHQQLETRQDRGVELHRRHEFRPAMNDAMSHRIDVAAVPMGVEIIEQISRGLFMADRGITPALFTENCAGRITDNENASRPYRDPRSAR